jgi:hypothetical protein
MRAPQTPPEQQPASPAAAPPAVARCWVVTEGLAGTENPCLGLAEALGLTPQVKRIGLGVPWCWLPPRLLPIDLARGAATGDPLAPPWPDLLIASGRKAVAPALAVRRAAGPGCFAVCVQDPRVDPARFDLVIAPEHDGLTGPNVLTTTGSLTRITAARLDAARARFAAMLEPLPRPRLAVLIGGRSRAGALDPRRAAEIGRALADLSAGRGAGLMVTTSRRTDAASVRALADALAGTPHVFHDPAHGAGDNPLLGYLGWADHIAVTDDSVTMASEAAATGRPLHMIPIGGRGRAKLARFHDRLIAQGLARRFDGTLPDWTPPGLDETARAAAEVRRRRAARAAGPARGRK